MVLAGSLLTGCYASTEPATEIGPETATLHAHGTANDGPATSYFEYWVTGATSKHLTEVIQWPAGASGPFKQKVTELAASTQYSFRVCGADDIESPVCANTRTFTTGTAVEDAALGGYDTGCCAGFVVDARSGPSGESPRGSMLWRLEEGQDSINFRGVVTCLQVDGVVAKIGAVGERTLNGVTSPYRMLATISDGRPGGDLTATAFSAGSTPPDCANAPPVVPTPGDSDHFAVNDAHP